MKLRFNLYWALIVSMLGIVLMLSAGIEAATVAEGKVKMKSSEGLVDDNGVEDFVKGIFSKKGPYKRVISDDVDENKISIIEKNGCKIKHRLKDSASFDCPRKIVSKLNVREARVFRIVDLEADQQIGADKVWAEGVTGEGEDVVILDTGVDEDHIELKDSIKSCVSFVSGEDCSDSNGHGTHISGIITGNGVIKNLDGTNDATGVSPGAGIHMLKVCGNNGFCLEDDMEAAMEYAVNNIVDARIMSISIGGGNFGEHCDYDPLAAKVNWVVDNGYTVAVAAGNDGKGVSSPACASKAIAVCAVNKNNILPWWSNRGSALDICGPGVDILSTYSCLAAGDCTTNWYSYLSGSSMSTPSISGTISLLLQANSGLTDSEIKDALYTTADQADRCYECSRGTWWGCKRQKIVACDSENTGAGIVNAYEAYLSVKTESLVSECNIDSDCDDGLFCNGIESCISGSCNTGSVLNCSGLNDQCNVGICDESSDSCVAQMANEGLSCDDGLFCNVEETCQAGVCFSDITNDCSDDNSCTSDSCNEETDSCLNTAVVDGTSCDDGEFCTVNEVCTLGVCVSGDARDCSDGVACTVDSCDEIGDSCLNNGNNSLCDNGLFCDGTEICDSSLGCKAGTTVSCDDNDACTTNSCNEDINSCEYVEIPECSASVKCWNAEFEYLSRSRSQLKKFCKCASGIYGYDRYMRIQTRVDTYSYLDSEDNENWETVLNTNIYRPVYRVQCDDGNWYDTNQNYFF